MDPQHLLQGLKTVSDQMRVLDAAGYSMTEIGKILGKRYQHVRNVLRGATPEQMRRAQAHVKRVSEGGPRGVEEDGAEWIGPGLAENTAPIPSWTPPLYEERGEDAWRLAVRADGSVVLPPAVVAALGLRPGAAAPARLEGENLILFSERENFRRMREAVSRVTPLWRPGDPFVSDELIADRRTEAAREDRGE